MKCLEKTLKKTIILKSQGITSSIGKPVRASPGLSSFPIGQWLSKWGSQTRTPHFLGVIRNANSQALPQNSWSETLGVGHRKPYFNKPSRWVWPMLALELHPYTAAINEKRAAVFVPLPTILYCAKSLCIIHLPPGLPNKEPKFSTPSPPQKRKKK